MDKVIKVCTKCWETDCSCGQTKENIDGSIYDTLKILNKKGYSTQWSCGGHIKPEEILSGLPPMIYISFNRSEKIELDPTKIGRGTDWVYLKTDRVLRYTMKGATSYKKINKYNITLMELQLIHVRNQLNKWAKKLPYREGCEVW
jgi:hypothetical protein